MNHPNVKPSLLAAAALILCTTAALVACGNSSPGDYGSTTAANAGPTKAAFNGRISLQASSTILANTGATPVNVMAIVTDTNGVAVAGQTVTFSVSDAKSGTVLQVQNGGVTDATGTATATLGLNGDPSNRTVTVMASVGTSVPAELPITIAAPDAATTSSATNSSRGQLSVRIGTNNLIEETADKLSYTKKYAVIVSDNAGYPQPNVAVSATVRPYSYSVGYYVFDGASWGANRFTTASGATDIPSEDKSNFGVCDAGEDVNKDGVLTPGNIVSYQMLTQTDLNGLAVLQITYPKSFAKWTTVRIEATAKVGGSEGFNALPVPLPMMAGDLTNKDTPPPSITRTYGSLFAPNDGTGIALTDRNAAAGIDNTTLLSGSPYPYQSLSRTCP